VTHHELREFADAETTARAAAAFIASLSAETIAERGECVLALSGGTTPAPMLRALATMEVDWDHVRVFQVDERVAPDGDAHRNLSQLDECLGAVPVRITAMPVTDADLDGAADAYAASLPARFDLVHLGLGADGHTASLVPGDHVLKVLDRLVAVTDPYQGFRRMTLTYPALGRADIVLWLLAGEDKRDALARLLRGDESIPAGRLDPSRSVVMADAAAASH
jgi:6-phosphogluconolactonase